LIDSGFDAVYHWQAYNALKGVYQGRGLDAYAEVMAALDDRARPHYLAYLENHDERRIPSPIAPEASAGDSGFGSSAAAYQLAPLALLYSQGPVMLLNGQEVGEPGEGATGFKGDNGRTTIFDYWRMPTFARWVNEHRYDGGQLEPSERALRRFYGALLQLCQHPSIQGSGYSALRAVSTEGAAGGSALYAFARFAPASGRLVVVVANFRPGSDERGRVRVPGELLAACGVPTGSTLSVRLILNESGACNSAGSRMTTLALAAAGFDATVSNQACNVYSLEPS
jgi:hypothetical protein